MTEALKAQKEMTGWHQDFDLACLIAIRVSLLALAFLSASVFTLYADAVSDIPGVSESAVALLLSFTVLNAYWIFSRRTGRAITILQAVVDCIYVSLLIYLTGGASSPFQFLYLAVIIGTSILASRSTGLLIAAVAFSIYGSLIGLHALNIIDIPGTRPGMTNQELLLQVVGLFSAMILIAVAASFIRNNIRRMILVARSTEEELKSARQRQQTLVNQILDGLITTDLEDRIITANETAWSLLGLSSEEMIGNDMADVVKKSLLQFPCGTVIKEYEGHEIDLSDDGKEQLIHISRKKILDGNGTCSGSVYIIQDVTKLRSIEKQLAVQEKMARLLSDDRSSPAVPHSYNGFIGESPVMKAVFNLIDRVATSDASVLINGESGTGKELVARSIHAASSRSEMPFVAVNCGAIPENLIESELFGHKKGSFTGADSDRTGLFLKANGGTLFLDEIGELPLHMQSKLLRAIQEKRVRAVGGDNEVSIDVRILSATNRNLRDESQKGTFREDLYFRLNVIGINLPPLKNRKEDLPLLIDGILRKINPDGIATVIAPRAMNYLMNYSYPGNVRELENILERALVLGGEVILPEHLPEAVLHAGEANGNYNLNGGRRETIILEQDNISLPIELDDVLSELERKYLVEALKQTRGAKKKAAELLGINFRSFRYRLRKFQIEGADEDSASLD